MLNKALEEPQQLVAAITAELFFTPVIQCPIPSQKIRTAISRERKELREIRWCQNDRIFGGFSDFQKKIEFLDLWICGFLYFCIFSDFWPYLGNEKSYRRSAGVKTTGFSRAFQISAWVTRPECPKGVKGEVKQARRAAP